MDRTTDGASSGTVDPGKEAAWESTLNSAISELDIDPDAPIAPDDPSHQTPQSDPLESSALAATPREPAGDDGQTPPPGVSDPATETDPLAAAEAFTYPGADGQPITFDGAFRIPGEGLYVPEDKVALVAEFATKAQTFERQVRELTDRTQTLDRQTSWQTQDAQGNVKTLTGAPALQAQREAIARLGAFHRELTKITAGEVNPHDALTTDANGNPVWRQDWIDGLNARATFEGDKAAFAVARHFDGLSAPPPPPEPSAASFAMPTIDALIQAHAITGLTDADKQFLAGQFDPYVRVTPRGKEVDPRFLDVMKDRAALRAEHAKVATTAATAGKFNTGMKAGLTAPKAPAKPAPPATPARPEKVSRDAPWQNLLQGALSDMAISQ